MKPEICYKIIAGSETYYYLKDKGWQEVQFEEMTFMFDPTIKKVDCQRHLEMRFGKTIVRSHIRT